MNNSKTTFPHQAQHLFLTDGGLETTLVFLQGFDLPYFAAFVLLKTENGYKAIENYYRRYLDIAKEVESGFILESPTWRANPDWIKALGYDSNEIIPINKQAVQLLADLKNEYLQSVQPILISGCVGPRGDGYKPGNKMNAQSAEQYHSSQIKVFAETEAEMISATTMNYAEEAVGIANAAAAVNLPCVISFTVETNGKLPSGMSLKEAIALVDQSAMKAPLYYMINCAHPSHFLGNLLEGKDEDWTKRIRGTRANASCKSHAELDESTELDRGNITDLGAEHKSLKTNFPHLNVFGGCCGTDEEHVKVIARTMEQL